MPKATPPQNNSLNALRSQRAGERRHLSLPERVAEATKEVSAKRLSETATKTEDRAPVEESKKAAAASPENMTYRRTKVLHPDPKIMRANRIVAPALDTSEADIFRMLRTQVLKRMKQRNARTLGICSALEGEGKSLVALNLAISLSQVDNRTVLLVELDLHRPSLLKSLGLSTEKGIDDVLAGEAEISDCLINPGYARLVLLPACNAQDSSSSMVLSTKMALLANELRERYSDRLIIYDLPPLLPSDVSIAFMHHLDAILLVVEEGRTQKSEIEHALSMIDDDLLIGTVLNKASKISSRHYGYS